MASILVNISISDLDNEGAEVVRVSNTEGVSWRISFGDFDLLRTMSSRARFLGGIYIINMK